MTSVNQNNPKKDFTVRVFDGFYNFELDVPVEQYDIVNSYFLSVFNDSIAANNFTVSLFRVSSESNTSVLSLLEEIKGQNQLELTASLAYYLNGLRSSSTLLGVNTNVTPNVWAARNVLI